MTLNGSSPIGTRMSQRFSIYLLGFVLLTVLWLGMIVLWGRPKAPLATGAARGARFALVTLPPMLLVGGLYLYARRPSVRKQEREQAEQRAREADAERERQEDEARQAALLAHRRFYLEVLAVGGAAEHLGLAEIWETIRDEGPQGVALPEDHNLYPHSAEDKERTALQRRAQALEQALSWLTEEWAIPTFIAGPVLANPKMADLLEGNLGDALKCAGVPEQSLKVVTVLHDEVPERVLCAIFEFLENHVEVPAVVLLAEDGLALRDCRRPEGFQPLLQSGPHHPGDLVGSMVAMVLGRRDRLDPMRRMVHRDSSPDEVLKPFWEEEQLRGSARDFVATTWVPQGWPKELLGRFSALPVLGHLHRPQLVTFQVHGEATRVKAFQEKWQILMEGRANEEKLSHLIYDFGAPEQGGRLTPLNRALGDFDPDWDALAKGVNLHRDLGDVGTNGAFLGLSLAVMAVQREGGMGVSVNLRQEGQASLCMVTEAPEQAPSTASAHQDAFA